MRHWSEKYIGLSYLDYDCAELCAKVQYEQFNNDIKIPIERSEGLRGISSMISNLKNDFAVKVNEPSEGDAILMVGRGRLNHIGIACFINDQLYVLHSMRNAGIVVLHNIISLDSIGLSIEGYYEWK